MNDLPVNSVIVNVDVSVVGKQWGKGRTYALGFCGNRVWEREKGGREVCQGEEKNGDDDEVRTLEQAKLL
jgi:hypothetical protein